jgi:hypothetical protein
MTGPSLRSAPVDGFSLVPRRVGHGRLHLAETAPAPEDRIAQPTRVLWPGHDPLFPREWSDRLDQFFSDVP